MKNYINFFIIVCLSVSCKSQDIKELDKCNLNDIVDIYIDYSNLKYGKGNNIIDLSLYTTIQTGKDKEGNWKTDTLKDKFSFSMNTIPLNNINTYAKRKSFLKYFIIKNQKVIFTCDVDLPLCNKISSQFKSIPFNDYNLYHYQPTGRDNFGWNLEIDESLKLYNLNDYDTVEGHKWLKEKLEEQSSKNNPAAQSK